MGEGLQSLDGRRMDACFGKDGGRYTDRPKEQARLKCKLTT